MNPDANWQDLAREMSDISEQAYYAGWMDELEYRLWMMLDGGDREYGQITVSEAQLHRLKEISDAIGGWVWFNHVSRVEEFVDRDQWSRIYDAWARKRKHLE